MQFFISSWIYSDHEAALLPREYFFRNVPSPTHGIQIHLAWNIHLSWPASQLFIQACLTALGQASRNSPSFN
jgi:hypothetical protein